MSRYICLAALSFVCLHAAEKHFTLRGRVSGAPSIDYSTLRIVVLDANKKTEFGVVPIRGDGSFRFSDLPAGVVEIQVLAPYGDPVASHYAAVPLDNELRLHLPSLQQPVTVTLRSLKYKPIPVAERHWERALRALKKHDRERATEELDEAIRLAPDFAEALEQRGLLALGASQFGIAATYLLNAVELDPQNVQYIANAAVASLSTGRDKDAEQLARRLLAHEPGDARANFLLGISLIRLDRNADEAEQCLERAEETYPEARRYLTLLRRASEHPAPAKPPSF